MKINPKLAIASALFFSAIHSAFSATPDVVFLQWTFGLSMYDDTVHTNELTFNGPSVNKTVGFLDEYSFIYDERGISTTALVQQDDPYKWYVRGALVLTSLSYVNDQGQATSCNSYGHFHGVPCPNVVGWFNNFAMPENLGETVTLISLNSITTPTSNVPEPMSGNLAVCGLALVGAFRARKFKKY